MVFRVEGVVAVASIERQSVGERGLCDAGDAFHAGGESELKKALAGATGGILGRASGPSHRRVRRGAGCRIKRDFRGDDALSAESRIDAGELVKAVQDKAGSCDDHDSEPDLGHDQRH